MVAPGGTVPASLRVVIAFTGASYLVWLGVFRIYRYAIPIELCASLLLVLVLGALLAGAQYRPLLSAAVLGTIVAITRYGDWGYGNWSGAHFHAGRYIDVTVPSIPGDSLVLLLAGEPVAYLVPFMATAPRVLCAVSNFTGPGHHNRLQREISALVANPTGPMYVIRLLDVIDRTEESALAFYRLKRVDDRCQPIESNLEEGRRIGICPLVARGSAD